MSEGEEQMEKDGYSGLILVWLENKERLRLKREEEEKKNSRR